ncbi:hypothetical protein [Prauserella muralis]|nr:hypothetical protein [Prauserella muralis]TWE22924.1 hypothetical protein FHX69_4182 [Prauserella muralis]
MTRTPLDARTGTDLPPAARLAMAASAVLAPALVILGLLWHRELASADDRATVTAIAADVDAFTLDAWMAPVATLVWIPAILAVARVARAGARGLGLAGLLLGFLVAVPLVADPGQLAYVAVSSGLDVDATLRLLETAASGPSAVFGWAFVAGLLGLVLLGAAILRGRSAPRWAGVALVAGPVAVVPSWASGSLAATVVTWGIVLIGFAGCAWALVTGGAESGAPAAARAAAPSQAL